MAQMTVACHFRVSIGASLEFSASLIIENFHSDRTFVLLPFGGFGKASHLEAKRGQNWTILTAKNGRKKVFRYACETSTTASGCPSGNSQSS